MSIRFPNLGLEFGFVPKSFWIFGFEITIFGMLLTLGMLLGMAFIVLEAKRRKQDANLYLGMTICGLLGGFVGARLLYVALSWSLYKTDVMKIFDTRAGGMVFYGGLLGGALAAALFCRIRKISFWDMADVACMGLLIGQMIGRWGNFFNRESFGEYTSNALTMQLPLSSVRAGEVTAWMRENLVSLEGVSYIQVTPVFLYESIWCLLLFLVLLAVGRRKLFQGEVFMRYLAGYGLGRFFIEWIRTDKLLWPGTDIAVSQAISAGLFVIFTITVFVKRIMAKKRAEVRRKRRERLYQEEEKSEIKADDALEKKPEEMPEENLEKTLEEKPEEKPEEVLEEKPEKKPEENPEKITEEKTEEEK